MTPPTEDLQDKGGRSGASSGGEVGEERDKAGQRGRQREWWWGGRGGDDDTVSEEARSVQLAIGSRDGITGADDSHHYVCQGKKPR